MVRSDHPTKTTKLMAGGEMTNKKSLRAKQTSLASQSAEPHYAAAAVSLQQSSRHTHTVLLMHSKHHTSDDAMSLVQKSRQLSSAQSSVTIIKSSSY